MQEDFIHYLWKFKKLNPLKLTTTTGQEITIKELGTHNFHSGPDFFNAQVLIDGQLWAGNVEMHVKSSDWYKHGHDDDPAYDNVILHVVWKHDAEISRRSEIHIPVLEVGNHIPNELILSYTRLFAYKNNQFINCEKSLAHIDSFLIENWLEKIYIQRLAARNERIATSLNQNNNDWEATFFQMLARSFGTKVNADAFEQTATSVDQAIIRKLSTDAFRLESFLLGQAGLLNKSHKDRYYMLLEQEYAFAKAKYGTTPIPTSLKFFRLRPANYPTVRLSQLAMLYHRNPLLFAQVLLTNEKEDIYNLFEVKAAAYWDNHHLFDKETTARDKTLTTSFIDLLIVNCIVPIKFAYAQFHGKQNIEPLLSLMRSVSPEKNTIVKGFSYLFPISNALESQAVLQLKPNYCDVNRCLHCDVGVRLMGRIDL